jgi:hypothetical protein
MTGRVRLGTGIREGRLGGNAGRLLLRAAVALAAWGCGTDPPSDGDGGTDVDSAVFDDAVGETDDVREDAGPTIPPPPRLVRPWNAERTGSPWAPPEFGTLRPSLWWRPVEDPLGRRVLYDVEVDDSCRVPGFETCWFSSPEARAERLVRTAWRVESDLPVSDEPPVGRRYYWRVRACAVGGECGDWSTVRYVEVGRVRNDWNGDGYSDLVVGAPDWGGKAYVFFGGPSRVLSDPIRLVRPPENTQFSWGIGAADLDADGFVDVVVGAPSGLVGTLNGGDGWRGSVSVFRGGPEPVVEPHVVWRRYLWCHAFGWAVAGVGDVDADGFEDVVVGTPYSTGTDWVGRAFVYNGGLDFATPEPVELLSPERSDRYIDRYGDAVGGGGDVNGDGFADVLVGASYTPVAPDVYGVVYVHPGGRPFRGQPSVRLASTSPDEEMLGYPVIDAGDVNGDGFSDILVAAQGYPGSGYNAGRAYLWLGGDPLPASPMWSVTGRSQEVLGRSLAAGDLDGDGVFDLVVGSGDGLVDGEPRGRVGVHFGRGGPSSVPDVALLGEERWDRLGNAAAVVGDLDGDGYDDLAVGVPQDFLPSIDSPGRVQVHFGGASFGHVPDIVIPAPYAAVRFGASFAQGGPLGGSVRSAW